VLLPVCRHCYANLVTGVGFQSITGVVNMLQRIQQLAQGKPVRVFYISDFDPAGGWMPVAVARQVEFYLPRYAPGSQIKLNPLLLTVEQVRQYRLPRIPIKDSDTRKGIFEERHGEGAVELDAMEALHPGELANIVGTALAPYRDPGLEARFAEARNEAAEALAAEWQTQTSDLREGLSHLEEEASKVVEKYRQRVRDLGEEVNRWLAPARQRLDALAEEMKAEVAALASQREALRDATAQCVGNMEPDLPELPEAEIEEPDESNWLFDSQRDYLEQMKHYPAKGRRKRVLTCQHCGGEFTPNKQNQQYCNARCRYNAFCKRNGQEDGTS
jgi:hypothetical protein